MSDSTATGRRQLDFSHLEEVIRDVEGLRAAGYVAVGKRNLAQICGHLAAWMTFPVDGFPKMGPVMRGIAWLLRNAMGKSVRRRILITGRMPARGQTIRSTIPAPDANEDAAIGRLFQAIDRFRDHPGEYAPSPLFGRMNRDDCQRMHLIHCAHHLSFLIPRSGS